MYWLLLLIAIGLEVIGTISLKMSDGLTKWLPAAGGVGCYAISLVLFAMAMKQIDTTVAYVVWSGIGTVMLALIGVTMFKEQFNPAKIGFILVILAGTAGLIAISPAR